MSAPLDQLPPAAVAAWTRLRDELVAILGDDLVALWGSGHAHPFWGRESSSLNR